MTAFNIDVTTPDGAMDCFVAHPDDGNTYPAVLLYMDVPGIREELRDFARRIAGEGYVCVLPDLYYREGKVRFDLSKGKAEFKRMFETGSRLSNAMVMHDTQAMLDYLDSLPAAQANTGTIGFCMSGQFVLSAAGTFPERIKATAALYGTRMVTDLPDSPHHLIPNISGELYFGFAAHDPYVEDHVVPTLTADLDSQGVRYELEHFANTEHGFSFPKRPQYDEAAAETAWSKCFNMYARALR